MEWLRANRDSLRAHTGELDYDMSGTISTDELLELFSKVRGLRFWFAPSVSALQATSGVQDSGLKRIGQVRSSFESFLCRPELDSLTIRSSHGAPD